MMPREINDMDERLLHLFHPVVIENSDEANVGFFVDQTREIAFAGFRRSWGMGDLFMRYRGPIKPFTISHNYGMFHYSDSTFQAMSGLPGKQIASGGREELVEGDCEAIFNHAYQQVAGYHHLVINPKQVLEFIDKRTFKSGVQDRVINIQGFSSSNLLNMQFAAKMSWYDGRYAVMFQTPNGEIPIYLDERSSLVPLSRVPDGEWIVVQPIGFIGEERIAKVMRLHEPGIRMSVQAVKSGILMPGSARYSLHEGEDNNSITELDIRTFQFIEDQDKEVLKNAPMLTIQLDTFERALKALSSYKRVELLYKNSHTPFVMVPFTKEGEPLVEVVASGLSQFRSGKVVTL